MIARWGYRELIQFANEMLLSQSGRISILWPPIVIVHACGSSCTSVAAFPRYHCRTV